MVAGSSLETAMMKEQEQFWARLWKATGSRSPNQVQQWAAQQGQLVVPLPPLEAGDILKASSSFKARTCH